MVERAVPGGPPRGDPSDPDAPTRAVPGLTPPARGGAAGPDGLDRTAAAPPRDARPARLPAGGPRAGQPLGPYDLEGELGRGGMGAVFRATERGLGRLVALKVMLELDDPSARARFQREALIAAGLDHPGIVRVFAAGEVDQVPFIACELVDGARSLTRAAGGLDPAAKARLVRDAALALGHAHARGVVHRDVKPDNLLVDAAGRLRVTDFGIASSRSLERLTRTGVVVGTPAYMAPEQLDGDRAQLGPWTDVWALGAILYELLAGVRPWPGTSLPELCLRLTRPAPALVAPGAPAGLAEVCARALACDPAARYPDGRALADDLERVLAGAASEAARARRARARRRIGVSLAVAGTLGAAALALASAREGATPTGVAPPRTRPTAPGGTEPGATGPVATPPAGPTPVGTAAVATAAPGSPPWWALVEHRPQLPLPAGLSFGARPGEYLNEKDGSVLVWVPPGDFVMGAGAGGLQVSTARVKLTRGFFLGKHEVTFGQYDAFAAATGRSPPGRNGSGAKGSEFVATDRYPVWRVPWDQAAAYCRWAGLRLPTEAEWEWAATGRGGRRFPWGDEDPSPERVNMLGADDGHSFTSPVGSFPAGASPFGCLDMAGNVAEVVADWFAAYPSTDGPLVDPQGPPDGTERVRRGGHFRTGSAEGPLQSTFRDGTSPVEPVGKTTGSEQGLRVCRSPD